MPIVLGNNWMHVSEFDLFVENSTKIPAAKRTPPGEMESRIGKYVVELINDGDTIQMGFGGIPEAVIAGLEARHDLGVHTEMFPVGLQDLVPKGNIASEGMGHRMISGTGGQLDFMIGSYYSPGGRGITLISSARKLKDGTLASSIIPELPPFTPVTVPRTFAQYVVTEYGIADLRYKTVRERAEALINIALLT